MSQPGAEGRIIDDAQAIDRLFATTKRVAVLGIKTEAQADQPAFFVPRYLQAHGIEVVPVPVYYPEVTTLLGVPVYRRLVDVPGEIDVVDVFRRPRDLHAHFEDIVAKHPRTVWLQLGIRDDDFARRLAREGIDVVQDRCLMVDHRRWSGARG